ncbi:MAG: hypothetical protein AB7S44_02930 [Spirochaetales bacterium]
MDNLTILNQTIEFIENTHPNPYTKINKEEFYKNKDALAKVANNLSAAKFDFEIKKLITLIEDPHTDYLLSKRGEELNAKFIEINGKYYMLDYDNTAERYCEILKINSYDVNYVIDKIKQIIPTDSDQWLKFQTALYLKNLYTYKMVGVAKETDSTLIFEVKNPNIIKTVNIGLLKPRDKTDSSNVYKSTNYSFSIMDDGVLYIKYFICRDDEKYPLKTMVEEIKKQNKNGNFIVDLRGNTGGNSEIMKPLLAYLKENNMTGAALIDRGVFSSGIFSVRDLKNELNATIIGEPTGGLAGQHFGNVKNLCLDDKKIICSTKLFKFKDLFDYEGPVRPDILIEKTIKDYNNNLDPQLDAAIKFLSKEKEL